MDHVEGMVVWQVIYIHIDKDTNRQLIGGRTFKDELAARRWEAAMRKKDWHYTNVVSSTVYSNDPPTFTPAESRSRNEGMQIQVDHKHKRMRPPSSEPFYVTPHRFAPPNHTNTDTPDHMALASAISPAATRGLDISETV